MNIDNDIPPSYRALMSALRGCVNARPPDNLLHAADWSAVLRQAREQGVYAYLYPWLAQHFPEQFSSKSADPAPAAAAWRALFLNALAQTPLRQRQLSEILAAFESAQIDVIILKGAWLGETVYADPAMRTMSDLDLLIREENGEACNTLLLGLGYTVKNETLHNPLAYDQAYVHPNQEKTLELHWQVASDMVNGTPIPDITAVWQNTSPADYRGHHVRALSPADQLAHLVHHILHHLFAAPVRCYVDIALVVQKLAQLVSPEELEAAGARWKTGRGIPFILRLTSDLLGVALPAAMCGYAPETDASRRAQALQALFDLPSAAACGGETTLLRFKSSSPLSRIRLVLSRIFMPRQFMVMHYPCARHTFGLPFAWLGRACDLNRQHHARIKAMLKPGTEAEHQIGNAASRTDLVNWLLSR